MCPVRRPEGEPQCPFSHPRSSQVAAGTCMSVIEQNMLGRPYQFRLVKYESNDPTALPIGALGPLTCDEALRFTPLVQAVYNVPVLSMAPLQALTDQKAAYPLFSRIAPSNRIQGGFLARVLVHFAWTPVCILQVSPRRHWKGEPPPPPRPSAGQN